MSSSIKDTLIKTYAKFFAIHSSPSEKELQVMGSTGQEKAETMKRYIRKVLILEYAKNFNKKLFDSDIKFYGEIYFCHSSIDNELNMHCHLIVSRKDQTNKKRLSPLTNHKNTKKGMVIGGFDRVNLFQQAEREFDKLFGYNCQQTESFDYHNTMKNGSIPKQFKLQAENFAAEKKKENDISCNLDSKKEDRHSYNQQNNTGGDSWLSIFSLGDSNNYDTALAEETQAKKRQKKVRKL